MSALYTALTAAAFTKPRTIDEEAGATARHLHLFSDIPSGEARDRALAKAVRCIKHPAVPPEMTETAFNVVHSGFPFGPEKRGICGRDECPCNQGHAETVEHTFWKCQRSYRLWSLLLYQWRTVTGEVKVTADLGRIILFGDRSGTWADMAAQSEWAGLEEPFAIMHKVALHTLFLERNRDAAPNPKVRRTASQLYQKLQSTVQRIVAGLWKAAVARRHADGGASMNQLRKRWEAPGLAVISADNRSLTVVLFMREATRDRWRRSASSARDFRTQQYAPPVPLPEGTIEIYTAGAAEARKKDMPDPPGGYGFAAYDNRKRVYTKADQITLATPNVTTITENLAELMAFTRGLQWARRFRDAQGRPINMRYTSEYCARIATGAWKAKKHKKVAAEARTAWKELKKSNGGQVWMQHDKTHKAKSLAERGKTGDRIEGGALIVD